MHDFVRAVAAHAFLSSPAVAAALLLQAALATTASAQPAADPPMPSAAASSPGERLAPVTITGKAPPEAGVAGFQPQPLSRTPVQAAVIDAEAARDAGARRLADLVRFDAGVGGAYTTEGYIDYFTVRGFVLDNRFNFRRDGLPASGETSFALDNKASVEILKGLAGVQAGSSSPGGLVNLVVKRPLDRPLSSGFLEWRERGSVLGAVDLSRRVAFGGDGTGSVGLRLNAAAERVDPKVRDADGHRRLLALAGDVRLGAATVVEAEIEHGRRSQPSVPGFSLLGGRVPEPVDPRINLNNQPWSLPSVFDTTTASLRVTQQLAGGWSLVVHGLQQQLATDDRIAFPFGCSAEGAFDRFCSDGSYDLYDFRSEDERRRTRALDVAVRGRLALGGTQHTVVAGVQRSIYRLRTQAQAFNFAGVGNVEGTLVTPPAPDAVTPGTDRDDRSSELYVRDAIELGPRWSAWLGLRHTRIARASVATDGSGATDFSQSFTSPFVALAYAVRPGQLLYASWGRGSESDVAPNQPRFANPGQAQPAARSRQWELGAKGGGERFDYAAAAFDIERPLYGDIGLCDDMAASCTRALDGRQRHRGVEGSVSVGAGPWDVDIGAQWLRARVRGRADPALEGREPTNVPAFSARLLASVAIGALPGLALQGGLVHEGERQVLPDNSLQIGSWTRVDLGARYAVRAGGVGWTLRVGVDNAFDRRAWRESPYQFAHAYLFPLAPRTARLSLQADL